MRLVLFAISAGLLTLLMSRDSMMIARAQESRGEYIAFRVDDRHVVAVITESDEGPNPGTGRVPSARFGFDPGDPDAETLEKVRSTLTTGKQWVVHIAPGQQIRASEARIVEGNIACVVMAGALLRIDPGGVEQFARVREKYFVAEQKDSAPASSTPWPASGASPLDRPQLERLLQELFTREFPRVQQEARTELTRAAAGDSPYHRTWANRRLQLSERASAGKAQLQYDLQTFFLERGGAPWHFVRAEWRVLGGTAFGASVWIRGGKALTIVDENLTPALRLNMSEFHDGLSRDHYGLVLNVVDRDGDGWAEVLFAGTGYEGGSVTLREASPTGFVHVVHYGFGC